MPLLRLALKPGIDKQNTEYGAEGGWTDCDNVRFRYGLPEKIGGWQYFGPTPTYLIGMTTDILTWESLSGIPYTIVGTNRKLYVYTGGLWSDITPIRATTDPGDVTFEATVGSNRLVVTDVDHGASVGDFVTFSGAVSLGGAITADILNGEYEILEVLSEDTYAVLITEDAIGGWGLGLWGAGTWGTPRPVVATSSDTGDGGGAVVATYQITVGQDLAFFNFGWGVGSWGAGTWGTPRSVTEGVFLFPRVWQFDTYGEDVVCQIVNGKTYYWDLSAGTNTRAVQLNGAPTKSYFSLVSTPDRHLVMFGTETTIGDDDTQDPMFVRFSSQEDIQQFVETATNTAGGQRLADGTKIVSAVRSRGQILIHTDKSLHAMQYIGPPFTFGFQLLGTNCGCLGAHASVDVNGVTFWMGPEAFYMFDGTVKKLPCTVQDYVFKDINLVQGIKVFGGLNSQFNEVTWFYCSEGSDYIDRCVTLNYLEQTWHIGSLSRTAWEDTDTYEYSLGVEHFLNGDQVPVPFVNGVTNGRSQVFLQEFGVNANGDPLPAYVTSGYFDIGDGDNMMFMKRFIPDFSNQQGPLLVNLLLRPYPQAPASPSSLDPYPVTPTTQKVDTRARGRQIALKIESTALNTHWRYGTLRVDIQPDGLR